MASMTNSISTTSDDPEQGPSEERLLATAPEVDCCRDIELEFAREQLNVLRDSMTQTQQRIEMLSTELRMLPWNWARTIRDTRLALAAARTALIEAERHALEARRTLQVAADELQAADAELAPRDRDRRLKAAGIRTSRMRTREATLLELRMNQAAAVENLRVALERSRQARQAMETQEQALTDVLARRRRQRSLLIQDIQSQERQHQREQLQYADYDRILAAAGKADAIQEDGCVPA